MKITDKLRKMWVGCAAVLLVLAAGAGSAGAADAEPVAVTAGKMELVNVAFPIQGFRVADPTVAKVEQQGAQQLRVMGVKAGSTDLQVTGDGSVSALYTITVSRMSTRCCPL